MPSTRYDSHLFIYLATQYIQSVYRSPWIIPVPHLEKTLKTRCPFCCAHAIVQFRSQIHSTPIKTHYKGSPLPLMSFSSMGFHFVGGSVSSGLVSSLKNQTTLKKKSVFCPSTADGGVFTREISACTVCGQRSRHS